MMHFLNETIATSELELNFSIYFLLNINEQVHVQNFAFLCNTKLLCRQSSYHFRSTNSRREHESQKVHSLIVMKVTEHIKVIFSRVSQTLKFMIVQIITSFSIFSFLLRFFHSFFSHQHQSQCATKVINNKVVASCFGFNY